MNAKTHRRLAAIVTLTVVGIVLIGVYEAFHRASGHVVAAHGLGDAIEAFERSTSLELHIDRGIPQLVEFPAIGRIDWQEFHPVRGGVILTGNVRHAELVPYFARYCEAASFNRVGKSFGWATEEEANLWLRDDPDLADSMLWGAMQLPSESGPKQVFLRVYPSQKRFWMEISP